MQLFLGLFLFAVLLTTGSSLECEICGSTEGDCSGPKQRCPDTLDTCLTLKTEVTAGVKIQAITKSCATEDLCKKYKELKGKDTTGQLPNTPAGTPSLPVGAVIKDVVCSKASPSFTSFFPALFGLLLMKLLS